MFQNKPLQLIEVKEEKLVLNQTTIEILSHFPTPLHIFSITCFARAGKSSTLNFLLSKLNVEITQERRFLSRAGDQSVTRGLWIWGSPLTLPNGEHLLLLDTQGTGLGPNEAINLQLSALSCMLSSLVILNIHGGINEEHKSILDVIRHFIMKSPGSLQERKMLFPTLLIRSRDYRNADLVRDFKQNDRDEILQLPPTDVKKIAVFDQKLNRDFQEIVDGELKQTTQLICDAFSERHWTYTSPPSEAEERVLNRGETSFFNSSSVSLSPFVQSMRDLTNLILHLSKPKTFGGAQIEMKVLLTHFTQFLQCIQEEKKTFHIPNVVQILQQKQIDVICKQSQNLYEQQWNISEEEKKDEKKDEKKMERKFQWNSIDDLDQFHEQCKSIGFQFYRRECKLRHLTPLLMEEGIDRLEILFTTSFLPHQNRFRDQMHQHLNELKLQAEQDRTRQSELGTEMKKIESNIGNINHQIQNVQVQVQQAEQKYHQLEMDKAKTVQQEQSSNQGGGKGGGGGWCLIL